MASVKPIDSLLQAYLDGEVSDSERLLVEQELADDPGAQELLERQRRANAMLYKSFGDAKLNYSLRQGVMAHLPEMDRTLERVREVNDLAKRRHRRPSPFAVWVPVLTPVFIAIFAVALWALWPATQTSGSNTIGVIGFREGPVQRSELDTVDREGVGLRNFVYPGQRYETGPDGSVMLFLAAGSELRAANDSRFVLDSERVVSVERGRMHFDVGTDQRLFRVETPAGVVTVFGTVFEVRVQPKSTVVTVVSGSVMVENDVTFAELSPNQQVTLSQGERPLVTREVDAGLEVAWAEALTADQRARELYADAVPAPSTSVTEAEATFVLERRAGSTPEEAVQLNVEWQPSGFTTGHCDYMVYVKEIRGDRLRPVYKTVLEGALFNDPDQLRHALRVPGNTFVESRLLLIQLVPDLSSGYRETDFTGVSALGI